MKKAYSLLELSIVAIIIGVLVSGVVAGAGMVRSSKVANARLFTTKAVVFEINGLTAWYEASLKDSFNGNQMSDGNAVTKWFDISPGSNSNVASSTKKNELTSDGGTTFIANGINGTPSIRFSGASSANFTTASFYQGTSLQNTVFLVLRPLATLSSTAQVVADSGASGSPTSSVGLKNDAIALNAGASANITTSLAAGTDYAIAAYFNDTVSQAFINSATTSAGSGSTGTNQLTGLTVGTDKSGANGFNGLISEIIVYNRPLKLQERKDVMNYLSKKYKITVTGL